MNKTITTQTAFSTRQSVFLALVIFCSSFNFLTIVSAEEDLGLCCLCDGCQRPLRNRADLAVDRFGTSCDDLALEMADPTNESKTGNGKCLLLKSRFHDRCCNKKHIPVDIEQEPTPAPGSDYEKGPHPWCDLCHDGSYPKNEHKQVAILGLEDGPYTCKDIYWMGQRGTIRDQLCNPLQDFFDIPCGCNARSGGGGGSGSGGGAPDKDETTPTLAPTIDPPKKGLDFGSEDDNVKLYNAEDDRGNLNRQRTLKGQNLRKRNTIS